LANYIAVIVQRLLGIKGETRQIFSCQQFCDQARIAYFSTPEIDMSHLMCMLKGTETRQNIGSNLSCWNPALGSAEAN